MTLTEPLDLLDDFPGWSTSFDLMARQEQSRHASGRTLTKDFGQPLWRGAWVTTSLSANRLDALHARIEHAMVSQMTFKAWQSSRCRPIAHPGSGTLPTGELSAIGDDDKTVRVADLTGITLSIGDMVRIAPSSGSGGGLYRVLEQASGDPTNLFTITPHLWPGTAIGQDVVIDKPWVAMTVDPGSLSASADPRTGRGSISFTATEAR